MAEVDHHGNLIPAPTFTKAQLWALVKRQGGKANISNAGHAAADSEIAAYPSDWGTPWRSSSEVMPGWSRTPGKDRDAN